MVRASLAKVLEMVGEAFADRYIMADIIVCVWIHSSRASQIFPQQIILGFAIKEVLSHLLVQFVFYSYGILYFLLQRLYHLSDFQYWQILCVRIVTGKGISLFKLLAIQPGKHSAQSHIASGLGDRYRSVFKCQHYSPLIFCVHTVVRPAGAKVIWIIGLPRLHRDKITDKIHSICSYISTASKISLPDDILRVLVKKVFRKHLVQL